MRVRVSFFKVSKYHLFSPKRRTLWGVNHDNLRLQRHLAPRLESEQMNPTKIIGIALIVLGALGLAYGGFSYTKETTGLKLGPIELKVEEKETVNVPLILSAGALALGVFLLVVGRK